MFTSSNQISGSGITYDAAGNVTNDGLGHTYTYDAEGRMLTVGGNSTATYVYDANGQRVEETVNGGAPTDFIYDVRGHLVTQATASVWQRSELYAGDGHPVSWRSRRLACKLQPQAELMRSQTHAGYTVRDLRSVCTGQMSDLDVRDTAKVAENHCGSEFWGKRTKQQGGTFQPTGSRRTRRARANHAKPLFLFMRASARKIEFRLHTVQARSVLRM